MIGLSIAFVGADLGRIIRSNNAYSGRSSSGRFITSRERSLSERLRYEPYCIRIYNWDTGRN